MNSVTLKRMPHHYVLPCLFLAVVVIFKRSSTPVKVVNQALDAGLQVTGSTVHYVTPEVDAGPVICREEVVIEEGDTEETLHERIKRVEHRLIVEAVRGYTLRM